MKEEDKKPNEKEVKTPEEVEPVTPVGTEDNGVKPEATPSLEEREANAKREKELLELEEDNKAKRMAAGRAEAGSVPVKPKEETDKEYKDRVMSGQ